MKMNETRMNNAGVRTPLSLPLQQQQSQLPGTIISPSTATPIGGGFGSAPGNYSNLGTNFNTTAVSKGLSGGDARLGGRTPINLSQQPGGAAVGGTLAGVNNPSSGAPPFSMFQRDQLMSLFLLC